MVYTRGFAQIYWEEATGNYRRYSAEIVAPSLRAWDFSPGDSFTLRIAVARSAAAPTQARAERLEVHPFNLPTGALIGSAIVVTVTADTQSTDVTVRLDANPGNGATLDALRSGFLGLRLIAIRTSVPTFDCGSDGSGTPPTGVVSDDRTDGYVRSRVNLASFTLSNVSLGGATPSVFASPDPIHLRATLSAAWYDNGSFTFALRQAGADVRNETLAGASASTRDASWTTTATTVSGKGFVNTGQFAKALTTTPVRLILPTTSTGADRHLAWADQASLPAGWTRIDDATIEYANPTQFDPRLTVQHHLQLNANTFATPPGSLGVATLRRLVADLAFTGFRLTNARGAGLDGVAATEKIWDAAGLTGSQGSPTKSRSATTATRGGEAGWTDALLTWDNALPGGAWTHRVEITTAHFTGLEAGQNATFTLLAYDPRVRVITGCGPLVEGDHWRPGMDFVAGLGAVDIETRKARAIDAASAYLALIAPGVGADAGYLTFLDSDGAWKRVTTSTTMYAWTASELVAGSLQYLRTWDAATTAAWPAVSITAVGFVTVNNVPYGEHMTGFTRGTHHGHLTAPTFAALTDSLALAQIPNALITEAKLAFNVATQAELDAEAATRAAADAAHASMDIASAHAGQLPEARVTMDPDGGHDHTGGAKGVPIGER